MKSIFKLILTLAILFLTSVIYGQYPAKKTKNHDGLVTEDSVKSSLIFTRRIKTLFISIIMNKVLIYKENLDGVVLNLGKKNVKMRLKKH